jgi:hypothetical protein
MTRKQDEYHAYLLRCWCEEQAAPNGAARWRFSVEEILHERRRRGFSNLESLVAFLRSELIGTGDQPASIPEEQ